MFVSLHPADAGRAIKLRLFDRTSLGLTPTALDYLSKKIESASPPLVASGVCFNSFTAGIRIQPLLYKLCDLHLMVLSSILRR